MHLDWLKYRADLQSLERQHMVLHPSLGPYPVLFGFAHDAWLKFKAKLSDEAELWTFRSPEDSWHHLAGREGLCIVREGRIVDTFVTTLS